MVAEAHGKAAVEVRRGERITWGATQCVLHARGVPVWVLVQSGRMEFAQSSLAL